jgi:hypothetical protein
MNNKEKKIVIDEIKQNPLIDFEQIKKLQASVETIKTNVNSKNEIDSLKNLKEVYEKVIVAAPALKSVLSPNIEAMNALLNKLNKKND